MIRAALFALGLAVCYTQPQPNWVTSADSLDYAYAAKDVGEYSIDGVCSLEGSGVHCWRPSGQPDQALGTLVDGVLSRSNSSPLRLAYHKRNLVLAVREPRPTAQSATMYYRGDRPTGPQSWLMQEAIDDSVSSRLVLAAMPVEPEISSTSVFAAIQVPLPPVKVSYGRRSKVQIGPYSVEIGKPVITPPDTQATYYGEWSIHYQVTPAPEQDQVQLHPVLLGRDGKPLRLNGPQKLPPTGNGFPRLGSYDLDQVGSPASGYWYFSADPKQVAALRLDPSYTRLVTFRNVALRPRQ